MISSNRTAVPLLKVFIVRSTGLVLMNADSAACGGLSIRWAMETIASSTLTPTPVP